MKCRGFIGFICVALSFYAVVLPAETNLMSQWVGVYPLTLKPGPNFINPPLHGLTVYRGTVSGVAQSIISIADDPNWTLNQFAAQQVGGQRFPQYLVLLKHDASGGSLAPDQSGEWALIASNTASALAIDPADDLVSMLAAGDEIEIHRLLSVRDLFGPVGSCVLHFDSNGFASRQEEDVIRYVTQTYFTSEVYYHDGSLTDGAAGYVIDGDGPFDGRAITIVPGQPLMVFRKDSSTNLVVRVNGQPQDGVWTQQLQPGPNPVANPYPIASPVASCGLIEGGWRSDTDGFGGNDDHIRKVVETSFTDEIFHHDGSYNQGNPAWVVNGEFSESYALEPGAGYMFFVRAGATIYWRHPAPFQLPE